MYGLVVDDAFGCSRDELMRGLAERGIETRTFFIPMHEQPILHERGLFRNEHYPVASDIGRRGLYLPSSTGLTQEEISCVVDAIIDVQRESTQRRPRQTPGTPAPR